MSDNFLDGGMVLPFGLLSPSSGAQMAAFNKTYRNTALRMGVIVKTYPIGDDQNRTGFATEYDVVCIEQYEDKGITSIPYKHCIAGSGLGSIADFFEKTFRQRLIKKYKSGADRLSQQDGSIVLLLCLDGGSEKGIIIGGFPHPDRPTTLVNDLPRLEGEYNGVNIAIENDGSAKFTWKGPTNNDGSPVTPSLTPTVAQVQNDGSFQISHKTITIKMDIGGVLTITSTGDTNISCANANVNASANVNVTAGGDLLATASGTATVEAPTVKLGKAASEAVIKGDTFKKFLDIQIHPTIIGPTGPPTVPMPPTTLSKKVKTE